MASTSHFNCQVSRRLRQATHRTKQWYGLTAKRIKVNGINGVTVRWSLTIPYNIKPVAQRCAFVRNNGKLLGYATEQCQLHIIVQFAVVKKNLYTIEPKWQVVGKRAYIDLWLDIREVWNFDRFVTWTHIMRHNGVLWSCGKIFAVSGYIKKPRL